MLVAVIASAIGGYLAARLRARWVGFDADEVFFRDTAHGFIAWAFATVLSAAALGAATTQISRRRRNGSWSCRRPGRGKRQSRTGLRRPPLPCGCSAAGAGSRRDRHRKGESLEVTRLWTSSLSGNGELAAPDRTYIARLIAAQTGMSQADAEKRVNDVVTEAKSAADRARRGAARMAFWMTAYLLFGAFAASLAAVEGGQLRDGTWTNGRLVPRPWR